MIHKYRIREVTRRLAYERYKAVFDAAKRSPAEAVRAAFQLVESYKGHHYAHVALAASDTVNFIIEHDEYEMIKECEKELLPTLIGSIQHEDNKLLLTNRLKEE